MNFRECERRERIGKGLRSPRRIDEKRIGPRNRQTLLFGAVPVFSRAPRLAPRFRGELESRER